MEHAQHQRQLAGKRAGKTSFYARAIADAASEKKSREATREDEDEVSGA